MFVSERIPRTQERGAPARPGQRSETNIPPLTYLVVVHVPARSRRLELVDYRV